MKISAKILGIALLGVCLGGGMITSSEVAWGSPRTVTTSRATQTTPGANELIDDIEISSLVFEQELELLNASMAIEDCLYGRRTYSEARTVVDKCMRNGDKNNEKVNKYQNAHPSTLGGAAQQLWQKRRIILEKMKKLLAKGKIERPVLRTFQEQSGELTQTVVVKWLGAKAERADEGVKKYPSARARDYYKWQVEAVATQKQMCITHQHLLELAAALANGKRIAPKEARDIQTTLGKLSTKMSHLHVAGSVLEAHKALINEIGCQATLAEATALLATDRSEDSINRLERCNKNLRKASMRAAKASLEALKSLH